MSSTAALARLTSLLRPALIRARPHDRNVGELRFLVAVACPLVLFAVLAYGVRHGNTFSWDRALVEYFDAHYYDLEGLRRVTKALVYAGAAAGAALAVLVLAALVSLRRARAALFWTLAIGGAIVSSPVLKALFQRPQIGEPGEYSFPSGNATASVALALSLALLLSGGRGRWAVALAGSGLVALNGLALVVLLWHYPSDVIAGWCVAGVWVAALWLGLSVRGAGCNEAEAGVNTR
jgi:membrane-associated phospholipid phosphatase